MIRVAGEEDNITGVFSSRVTFQQIDSLGIEKVISQNDRYVNVNMDIKFTPDDSEGIQYINHTANKRQLTSARGLRK